MAGAAPRAGRGDAPRDAHVAETGRGAWLNQRKLRVAARTSLDNSVFATGTPWIGKDSEAHNRFAAELNAMTPVCAGIRRYGSAALDLAWVASGRFDGFWERGLSPWDIAAGVVLVREAGGAIREIDGGELLKTGSVIASNADLLPAFERQIRRARAFAQKAD